MYFFSGYRVPTYEKGGYLGTKKGGTYLQILRGPTYFFMGECKVLPTYFLRGTYLLFHAVPTYRSCRVLPTYEKGGYLPTEMGGTYLLFAGYLFFPRPAGPQAAPRIFTEHWALSTEGRDHWTVPNLGEKAK